MHVIIPLKLNTMFSVQVDAPCAYVCAESRIYDATGWYICQVMSITATSSHAALVPAKI